jgi:hypothetical protein
MHDAGSKVDANLLGLIKLLSLKRRRIVSRLTASSFHEQKSRNERNVY